MLQLMPPTNNSSARPEPCQQVCRERNGCGPVTTSPPCGRGGAVSRVKSLSLDGGCNHFFAFFALSVNMLTRCSFSFPCMAGWFGFLSLHRDNTFPRPSRQILMSTANSTTPGRARRQLLRGLTALLGVAVLPWGLPALASPPQDRGKGPKEKDKQRGPQKSSPGNASVVVSAGIDAGRARALAVEMGVAVGGTKPLPPGIRKNLAHGKPIPPGIARTRLPPGYLDRLPYITQATSGWPRVRICCW
jgi:hypothetical protein